MNRATAKQAHFSGLAVIPVNGVQLAGMLVIPHRAKGVVLFAHGSGSSRHSPRNNFVADALHEVGYGTLLMDLLTRQEDLGYENRFDIDLLVWRLERATQWLMEQPETQALDIGYFGASTGAAAALSAAATFGPAIGAVVSRGGRPDLAMAALNRVQSPTLLIVGGLDNVVIELNRQAYEELNTEKHLAVVPGATHLFEEPGTLQEVAHLAPMVWPLPRAKKRSLTALPVTAVQSSHALETRLQETRSRQSLRLPPAIVFAASVVSRAVAVSRMISFNRLSSHEWKAISTLLN